MTTLLVVGINHRTAPLAVREQAAIPARELLDTLRQLQRHPEIQEVVVLSTCNRVELYVVTPARLPETIRGLLDFLSYRSRLPPHALAPHLYSHAEASAVAHLFRVTAGLDSMILGETEITAQVKHAYQTAHAAGTTGPTLNRLFQRALHSTKAVRSQTRIAEGQASIGSVVVALARRVFGESLAPCEALLWGAGKAAEATARHLVKAGIGHLWIVNRTQPRAQELAGACRGMWLSWEQALAHLAHVDIAVVCTQAPHYVIEAADVERAAPRRAGRPLFIIDLAVPRNVDPALREHPGVQVYNVDDLTAIAQQGLAQRQEEVTRCQHLIEQHVEAFLAHRHPARTKEDSPCQSAAVLSSL